jgi:hypothetical protein
MDTKNCQIWQNLHFQMKNSNKKQKQKGMVLTICGDAGVLLTWSVRIFKYGNPCKYSQKIRLKGGQIG